MVFEPSGGYIEDTYRGAHPHEGRRGHVHAQDVGAATFSGAGPPRMKVVSPGSALAMATGLGQSGDTVANGKLWRGEEHEDQEMQAEPPEGIEERSKSRAPNMEAGGSHLQAGAKLNSEIAEAEEEEAERPTTRRAPKGPTQRERAEHEATHIPYRDWRKHTVRRSGKQQTAQKQTC